MGLDLVWARLDREKWMRCGERGRETLAQGKVKAKVGVNINRFLGGGKNKETELLRAE